MSRAPWEKKTGPLKGPTCRGPPRTAPGGPRSLSPAALHTDVSARGHLLVTAVTEATGCELSAGAGVLFTADATSFRTAPWCYPSWSSKALPSTFVLLRVPRGLARLQLIRSTAGRRQYFRPSVWRPPRLVSDLGPPHSVVTRSALLVSWCTCSGVICMPRMAAHSRSCGTVRWPS